jgi:trimeric autotransporter adhesin
MSAYRAFRSLRCCVNNINGLDLDTDFIPRLSITNAGNVGIGTRTPGSLLTLTGVTNWGQAEIVASGTNGEASMGFRPTNIAKGATGDWLIGTNTGAVGVGNFGIQNASTSDLTILANGNVGINTTSPKAQLDVEGTGNAIYSSTSSFGGAGIQAYHTGTNGFGTYGLGSAATDTGAYGGASGGTSSYGVWGDCYSACASDSASYAGYFSGNMHVNGSLTVGGVKNFKIDHPTEPATKYLFHASIESSEMINLYTGNVTLDSKGEAVVILPKWFQAENGDFRYSLTCVGGFAPVYVAEEISDNQFKIAGGKPGMKVSWQVTGTRQDAYAKAHPMQVEVEKPAQEQGYYIHPELYGAPEQKSIEWAHHPDMMKKMLDQRSKAAQPTTRASR